MQMQTRKNRRSVRPRAKSACRCATVFCLALSLLLSTFNFPVEANHGKTAQRIGVLMSNPGVRPYVESFRQGLKELGYIEGDNIAIEYRVAEGRHDQFVKLASELVRLKVDVIVCGSTPLALVVKNTTHTIPIVMAAVSDPVRSGLVASLAQPGGNATGLSMRATELSSKRLQVITEIIPKTRVIGMLWNPKSEADRDEWLESEHVTKRMGITLQSIELDHTSDFLSELKSATRNELDAAIVLRSPYFNKYIHQIVKIFEQNRLPAMYANERFVKAGGLMYYGVNLFDLYKRAATYVDKILKGTEPAELPVEQASKLDFVINLQAARNIGLLIPPEIILGASEVIK